MYKPLEYHNSVPFSGDPAQALSVARTTLLSLGFEIQSGTDRVLEAEGPGMHSNQQPALVGVSYLHVNISDTEITINATLGGTARMKNFITYFPPLLVLAVMIFNSLLGVEMSLFYVLMVLPWFVISPLISKAMEKKTLQAVDRLIRAMAQA